MSRATDAYTVLNRAMGRVKAECLGDQRFIEDGYPAEDLARICERCPIFTDCYAYASIAKPAGGFWAGRRWKGNA